VQGIPDNFSGECAYMLCSVLAGIVFPLDTAVGCSPSAVARRSSAGSGRAKS
jgi:hypothetical protein